MTERVPRLPGLKFHSLFLPPSVMPVLVTGIHALLFSKGLQNKTWIPGTRPGMTN